MSLINLDVTLFEEGKVAVNIVDVSSFVQTVRTSFNQEAFWTEFRNKHAIDSPAKLITLIIDLTRSHFSPNSDNVPGFDVSLTYYHNGKNRKYKHTFIPGKRDIQNFVRGKGSKYSYSGACLASAGLFYELFGGNANAKPVIEAIPGSYDGYTQYCSTLAGFTEKDLDNCYGSFKTWVSSVGLTAREDKVQDQVRRAAVSTIENIRNDPTKAAFNFQQVMEYCIFDKVDPNIKGITKGDKATIVVTAPIKPAIQPIPPVQGKTTI